MNNFVILYFSITFCFCAYIFDFQLWHIMFVIDRYVTKNDGQRYLSIGVDCKEASLMLWCSHIIRHHTNIHFYKYNFLFFFRRKLSTNS